MIVDRRATDAGRAVWGVGGVVDTGQRRQLGAVPLPP